MKARSPWIEFFGMFSIVMVRPGLKAAYAPRYEADEASPSIVSVFGALSFWLGLTLIVEKVLVVVVLMPNFSKSLMVISTYGFEVSSPFMRIVNPFSMRGDTRSREVMY